MSGSTGCPGARRLVDGLRVAEPDPATFYGGGDAGYVDYPVHH